MTSTTSFTSDGPATSCRKCTMDVRSRGQHHMAHTSYALLFRSKALIEINSLKSFVLNAQVRYCVLQPSVKIELKMVQGPFKVQDNRRNFS